MHCKTHGRVSSPWMRPVIFEGTFWKFIMSNATLFIRGSIHQGDSRFSDISRGRQCAFMSLSALLCTNSHDISTWTTSIGFCSKEMPYT